MKENNIQDQHQHIKTLKGNTINHINPCNKPKLKNINNNNNNKINDNIIKDKKKDYFIPYVAPLQTNHGSNINIISNITHNNINNKSFTNYNQNQIKNNHNLNNIIYNHNNNAHQPTIIIYNKKHQNYQYQQNLKKNYNQHITQYNQRRISLQRSNHPVSYYTPLINNNPYIKKNNHSQQRSNINKYLHQNYNKKFYNNRNHNNFFHFQQNRNSFDYNIHHRRSSTNHTNNNTKQTLITDYSHEKNNYSQQIRLKALFNDIFGFTKQLHRQQNRQKNIRQQYQRQNNITLDKYQLQGSDFQHHDLFEKSSKKQRQSQIDKKVFQEKFIQSQIRPIKRISNSIQSQEQRNQNQSFLQYSKQSQPQTPAQSKITTAQKKEQIEKDEKSQRNQLIIISQNIQFQYSQKSQSDTPAKNIIQSLTSSYSLQQLSNQQQRKLFWQLLQSEGMNYLSIYPKMEILSRKEFNTIVKIGQNQTQITSNLIIAAYITLWLNSMGYQDNQTKSRIIKTVSFSFPNNSSAGQIAQNLYDNLFHQFLPVELQLNALLNICKKGWEYFSFLICKFIRILSKNKNYETNQFYRKLSQAINQ